MRFKHPLDQVNCEVLPAYNCGWGVYSAHALWYHYSRTCLHRTPVASTRRVVFLLFFMTTEGSSAPSVPEAAGGSLPIANFKALLKDSLSEVLRENPSLLQPRGETQRGELAASVGEGGKVIYRLCPGVVSEAKWRGCSVLGVATVAGERHRILSGCSAGRGCHVGVGTAPGGGIVGRCRSSSSPTLSLSPSLSPPLSLLSLLSLPPLLSNGGAGATLGEMPDGGVVEGLGLPVISPSEGVLGVPVVLSDPGMGETVEGPLVSHAKSGEGGAGEETTLRAKGGEKTVEAPPSPFCSARAFHQSPPSWLAVSGRANSSTWRSCYGTISRHSGGVDGRRCHRRRHPASVASVWKCQIS